MVPNLPPQGPLLPTSQTEGTSGVAGLAEEDVVPLVLLIQSATRTQWTQSYPLKPAKQDYSVKKTLTYNITKLANTMKYGRGGPI